MQTSPKQIGYWNGITHGKAKFANLEDAQEYSIQIIKEYASRDCGWYWSAGDISQGANGTYWVVTP
jgi:hypothetical protein